MPDVGQIGTVKLEQSTSGSERQPVRGPESFPPPTLDRKAARRAYNHTAVSRSRYSLLRASLPSRQSTDGCTWLLIRFSTLIG